MKKFWDPSQDKLKRKKPRHIIIKLSKPKDFIHTHTHTHTLSCVQFFVTSWTIALQAPLSMESSRQEYWNGLTFPPSGDLPNPGIIQGVKFTNKGRTTEMVTIKVSRLFFSFYTFFSNKYSYHMQKLQHCLIGLLMCVTSIV